MKNTAPSTYCPENVSNQKKSFRLSGKVSSALFFLMFLYLSAETSLFAQDSLKREVSDSIAAEKIVRHSARRATYYSMILPGLGQAYNHKYWKIPIVYAGFGTLYYFIQFNTRYYRDFRDAYDFENTVVPPNPTHPFPEPPNDLVDKYDKSQLLQGREYYRRNLEVSYILTGVWYILTIVDATVDAHFFDYEINPNLSLQLQPALIPPAQGGQFAFGSGLNLTLKF